MDNYPDDVLLIKDGVPHYTGEKMELLKEYKRRVEILLAKADAQKEPEDRTREKKGLALRLLEGLHGKAWKCVDGISLSSLAVEGGHKLIITALEGLDIQPTIKKNETFDKFFFASTRRRGQSMDDYIRRKGEEWESLVDLDNGTTMSDDLMAYFLLKGAHLSTDQQRQIILNNNSEFTVTGFEKALKVVYHDIHTKDGGGKGNDQRSDHGNRFNRYRKGGKNGGKRYERANEADDYGYDGDDLAPVYEEHEHEEDREEADWINDDEAEFFSDDGASQDDEVHEAHSAYDEARKKLHTIQKSRGFSTTESESNQSSRGDGEDRGRERRREEISEKKKRTRCGSCGQLGHWTGDLKCPHSSGGSRGSRGRGGSRGSSRGSSSRGGSRGGRKHSYFTLDSDEMRELRPGYANAAESFSIGSASEDGDIDMGNDDWQQIHVPDDTPSTRPRAKQQQQQQAEAASSNDHRPNFEKWSLTQLRNHLRELGCMVSGNKAELSQRLHNYYDGGVVQAFDGRVGETISLFQQVPVQADEAQGSPPTRSVPMGSASSSSSSGTFGNLSRTGGTLPRCPRCGGPMIIRGNALHRGNALACKICSTFMRCPGTLPLP